MAILHGSWVPRLGRFFIWGEIWQRTEALQTEETLALHPFAMEKSALTTWLQAQSQDDAANGETEAQFLQLPQSLKTAMTAVPKSGKGKRETSTQPQAKAPCVWDHLPLALPSRATSEGCLPQHSAATDPLEADQTLCLQPWLVGGWSLSPEEATTFLLHLPLGTSGSAGDSILGDDLKFWGHVTRWGLDLMARGKFLPRIEVSSQRQVALWDPLLDSANDQARLQQFADRMPLSCLAYGQGGDPQHPARQVGVQGIFVSLMENAATALTHFLEAMVDTQVRAISSAQPVPATTPLTRELPLREWLQALSTADNSLDGATVGASRLRDILANWTAPLQTDNKTHFRARFTLHPPKDGGETWTLAYGLSSAVDPNWAISAPQLWQHPVAQLHYQGQTLPNPQETLLAGLGRAARLYDPIRASLLSPQPEHCLLDPIQAYEFIKAGAWRLQDNGFSVVLPDGITEQTGGLNSRLGLKVRAEVPKRQKQRLGLQSLLNFKWELSLAGETLSQQEFEALLAQRSPIVEINGRWVELRPQDVKAAQQFFSSRKTETPLSVEDALRISTGDTQMIDKLPVVSFEATGALQKLIDTLTTGNQTLEPMAEPEGFRGQLRPYQARGVSWLAFLEQWGLGACLADDMGLGKTIQLIAFLLYLRQSDFLEAPVLLVCPTSVLGNWEKEVKRFAPNLKTLVYHGDKRPHGSAFVKAVQPVNLVITSYALVQRDLKDLQRIDWQGVVLDEAQNIKNPSAKQSKSVRQLEAQFRIALTGTPVENRLGELWSIMDFLNPGYLGPQNFFQRRFATPIERYGDTASVQTLRSLVQPFILRRLKTDKDIIQDLPEKQEMAVFCALSPEQANLYQAQVDQSLEALDDAEGVQRRGQILALLTKLKQICNHPALFLQESTLGGSTRSAKLDRFDAMVEELLLEGDRALIFTQFATMGKLLQAHLQKAFKQETLLLYGNTSKNQREAMVDRFQHDPSGPRLFILSLKAGGVGLNLTRANHVFHFDRWWNPAVENQATDRAFRIGQTRNVQVHKFVCRGTLEERIHEMIESKQALSEQVVGTGENWLTELDTQQLRNLLLLDRSAVIDESDP